MVSARTAGAPEFDPAQAVSGLPHLPGVYRMLNSAGEVLYVGKALDLKKRVTSYFQKQSGLARRIRVMLAQVSAVETTVTRSEAEALLLENNLIKTLTPRYNILFRDDKSYPYLMLSGAPYPRLGFHRGSRDKRHRYFGPFPNAGAVRESIQLLQKVFRIRTCEDTVFSHRSRPCLLYQIRRCTGPCVKLVSESAYAEDVKSAELFISGRGEEVIDRLVARMNAASERMEYEEAALIRDQIAALHKVREKQFVSSDGGGDADVIACARAAELVCVNLVMIRGGHHLGDKNFFPRNADGCGTEQVIEAFLHQHYLEQDTPPRIVIGTRTDASALEMLLSERAGRKVRITVSPAGVQKAWLEMAAQNARLGAEQVLGMQANQEARLTALQRSLELPGPLQRIECFDISHTMGEATVASCVVYDKATMQKSDYRRYNIQVRTDDRSPSDLGAIERTQRAAHRARGDERPAAVSRQSSVVTSVPGVTPGDDYAALREVLSRRYRKVVAGEGRVPDLVLIDGGRGQLAVAEEVFAELGLSDVELAAVAKGEERKPGMEQLLLRGRAEPLRLGKDHPALHLVQQVRDEAHRFAIQGHRARRGKARASSSLEHISGVGAKRRQRLLAHFGGLRGVLAASIEDLAGVEGISRALAERIYHELH
ncbi:MAG: excinuclease ABC subunit UvrC [Betaproteobacteria bacterium]|nr:excinuclease ABC subunit UvrC [Betaproteobacteria bacterium]